MLTKNLLFLFDKEHIIPIGFEYMNPENPMTRSPPPRLMRLGTVAVAVALLALTSCTGLDDTQQKLLSGGAAGAVIGTVGIALTGGCIPCGTAIGGVVGAGAGYLLDQIDKSTRSP